MGSRIRTRTLVLGALALAVAATPGYSRSPSDFVGEYDVAGSHSSKGDYSGNVKITDNGRGELGVRGTYAAANGEKFGYVGTGRVEGNKLSFTMVQGGAGLVGGFWDRTFGSAKRGHGSYELGTGGKMSGSWALDSGRGQATESLTFKPVLVVLVAPGGRDAKEEVVPVRRVPGANDLIDLKISKAPNAPAGAKLEVKLSSGAFEVFGDAALTRRLASGTKLDNESSTFKVKGLSPTEPGSPATVTVRLVGRDGAVLSEDAVKVHVARSAFLLSGHGDFELGRELKKWIADGLGRPGRDNPKIVNGKDGRGKPVYYSVYFFDSDDGSRIALSTEGAIVAYHGHSNFGLGYAFRTGFSRVSQFFNIADPQVPVNWPYLRDHQEHPQLTFEDAEYADDASTPEFSDPMQIGGTVLGRLKNYGTSRYPERGGFGTRLHLTRGTAGKKWLDYHYTLNNDKENARIVVKAGSGDMPEKRWSKLLLLSCYSGPYYFDSFGGRGTLFYTWDEALCASEAASIFLRDQMIGKTDDQVLKAMNKVENVCDYHKFSD